MRALVSTVKKLLRPKSADSLQPQFENVCGDTARPLQREGSATDEESAVVDYAPAGRYSPRSPTPSKVAVVFFYLSVAFCMIGCIMIVRAFFLKNSDAEYFQQILITGSTVCAVGLIFAAIMNAINVRENRRFVAYVSAKAEEMVNNSNSRQRFNLNHSNGQVPMASTGPNGTR